MTTPTFNPPNLTFVDFSLALAVMALAYYGFRLGFLRLASFLAAAAFSSFLAKKYSALLVTKLALSPVPSYLLLWFLFGIFILVLGHLLSRFVHLMMFGWLDRLLGIVAGIFLAGLLVMIVAGIWSSPTSGILSYCRAKIKRGGLTARMVPLLPHSPVEEALENFRKVGAEMKKVNEDLSREIKDE